MAQRPAVSVEGLRTQFGAQVIHDGLELTLRQGEVLGVVGGSGTGKSVLLREIIGLQRPTTGRITLLGEDVWSLNRRQRQALATRTGVLFQDGALFSSLTVAENIQVAMREHLSLKPALMDDLAALKIAMVGLPPEAGAKLPSELSGGMRKRAGLARALALDPEILFLDEPTAGLDPIGAAAFDELIGSLKRSLDLTVFMVTHDLDSLAAVCDRIAALVDKQVRVATMAEHMKDDHPWLKEYFHGPRARAVKAPARADA
ncbi:MAG: ABC transporter ATP-binding protein [Marivibrio sp.]|uniref:ABC transporter ATP-binding protein n=1 Tax=Marivibrio sp. TaxID=2039719 RepID=UPI0032EFAF28